MKQKGVKDLTKIFFIIVFVIIIILAYKVIAPFITAIISAIILSYIFHPVYKKINNIFKSKNASSIIIIILIFLVILIPLFFIASALIQESLNFYRILSQTTLPQLKLIEGIKISLEEVSQYLTNYASKILISIPKKIIDFFVMIFLMFFFFRDGEKILKKIKENIPMKRKLREELSKNFSEVTHGVIFGVIVTGFIQGLLGGLGFLIFGIPNPILWGLVMAILAILPIVGPYLVWIPLGIYLIATGNVLQGILLLIYGVVIISAIDNLIRPFVISARTKIHPAIILIGILGGLYFMGIIGLIIGPLVLSFLIEFLKIYKKQIYIK